MSKIRELLGYVASITPNKVQDESVSGYKTLVPLIIDATHELDEMEEYIRNLEKLANVQNSKNW